MQLSLSRKPGYVTDVKSIFRTFRQFISRSTTRRQAVAGGDIVLVFIDNLMYVKYNSLLRRRIL